MATFAYPQTDARSGQGRETADRSALTCSVSSQWQRCQIPRLLKEPLVLAEGAGHSAVIVVQLCNYIHKTCNVVMSSYVLRLCYCSFTRLH